MALYAISDSPTPVSTSSRGLVALIQRRAWKLKLTCLVRAPCWSFRDALKLQSEMELPKPVVHQTPANWRDRLQSKQAIHIEP